MENIEIHIDGNPVQIAKNFLKIAFEMLPKEVQKSMIEMSAPNQEQYMQWQRDNVEKTVKALQQKRQN